jgi:hypothetical protein
MTTPTVGFNDLTFVTLVADADTPARFASRVGKVVGVAPNMVSPLPAKDTGARLYDMPGYAQLNPTSGDVEWVMGEVVNKATRTAIRTIPGSVFVNAGSRQAYLDTAVTLHNAGIPAGQIVNLLTALYNAAAVEVAARTP